MIRSILLPQSKTTPEQSCESFQSNFAGSSWKSCLCCCHPHLQLGGPATCHLCLLTSVSSLGPVVQTFHSYPLSVLKGSVLVGETIWLPSQDNQEVSYFAYWVEGRIQKAHFKEDSYLFCKCRKMESLRILTVPLLISNILGENEVNLEDLPYDEGGYFLFLKCTSFFTVNHICEKLSKMTSSKRKKTWVL